MAMLIGQIECYKFQQQTDDLPQTLITADRHWNMLWGEQTFGLSSVFKPVLSFWNSVTLYKQSALAAVKAKKRAAASHYLLHCMCSLCLLCVKSKMYQCTNAWSCILKSTSATYIWTYIKIMVWTNHCANCECAHKYTQESCLKIQVEIF